MVVGIVLLRWGGTDSSQNNASYAWEWFTLPVVVVLSYLACVPVVLLGWAWGHLRRTLHLAPPKPPKFLAPAAPPQPTVPSLPRSALAWCRRWMAAEGLLVFDDENILV